MKPSEICKKAGLKNLEECSERSGVSVQTLTNWSRDKPKLFNYLVRGVALDKEVENDVNK